MSFIVNGTTFYEPSDFSLLAKGAVVYLEGFKANDLPYRVLVSDFADANHSHYIIQADANNLMRVLSDGGPWIKGQAGHWTFTAKTDYSLKLSLKYFSSITALYAGSGTYFKADDFILHSSWAATKTDIQRIESAQEKMSHIVGKTFKIDGVARTGFVVDDFATQGIVGLFIPPEPKDSEDEGGYSILAVVAILSEALKEETQAREDLEARVAALEAQLAGIKGVSI